MQLIEYQNDTSTKHFNYFDKIKKNKYKNLSIDSFKNINYVYSWFLRDLDKEKFLNHMITDLNNLFLLNTYIYDNDFEIEENKEELIEFIVNRYKLYSNKVIKKLINFSKLEENWDSNKASKINWIAITNAIEFLMKVIKYFPDSPIPFIAPVPDGRIHFEWQRLSNELHHLIPNDNSDCYIYRMITKKGDTLSDYFDSEIGLENMLRIYSIWYGFNKK